MTDLDKLVDQVITIDNSKSREDILIDLKHTNSVEATINRIFDGQFLNGTERDPSLSAIIIDSDEEQEVTVRSMKESTSSSPIILQDSSEDNLFKSSQQTSIDEPFSKPNLSQLSTVSNEFDNIETNSYDDNNDVLPISSPRQEINFFNHNLENDSDELSSLPSMDEFLDEILSQKYEQPVVEILDDSDDDDVKEDKKKKGKKRATDLESIPSEQTDVDNQTSTRIMIKEQRKLEIEERKKRREEAAEERKRRRIQLAEERKRLKEQRQLEKERQLLYEKENRQRTDRTEILKEMILDIHPDFLKSTNTGKLLETTLHEKDVDVRNLLIQDPYEPAYTIAWRRKCRSEWNMDSQTFIPLETMKIMNEPVVLVHIDSLQFVHHVKNNTMNSYIDRIQKSCQNRQIILMIEGLDNYYKKKKLLQRRQFDSQVRQTMSQNPIKKRNNRNNEDLINGPEPAMVEECINYLQLVRHVMFVLTKDDKDSARWIESLTIDLGLGRYKSKNINNSYRVSKSGTDPQDTYFKMLQEIQLCTPAVAKSIMYAYPTLQSLHQSYEANNKTDGELMLSELEVERSAFQARDRKVNRVMSKKIYTIFNSDDPEQIIY